MAYNIENIKDSLMKSSGNDVYMIEPGCIEGYINNCYFTLSMKNKKINLSTTYSDHIISMPLTINLCINEIIHLVTKNETSDENYEETGYEETGYEDEDEEDYLHDDINYEDMNC